VEFHACVERGQSFFDNDEWGDLRSQQTAETNRDRKEPNDFGEIHLGSFDFTLGAA
jgi:hypothetical protein